MDWKLQTVMDNVNSLDAGHQNNDKKYIENDCLPTGPGTGPGMAIVLTNHVSNFFGPFKIKNITCAFSFTVSAQNVLKMHPSRHCVDRFCLEFSLDLQHKKISAAHFSFRSSRTIFTVSAQNVLKIFHNLSMIMKKHLSWMV